MIGSVSEYYDYKLSGNLNQDIAVFKNIFKRDSVLRIRYVSLGGGDTSCCLLYMDGMVNSAQVGETVVRPLVLARLPEGKPDSEYIAKNVLFANEVSLQVKFPDMLRAMLYGDTLLLTQGDAAALTINTKGWRTRGISEPNDERVLQGPREGFDEAAMFNLAMIRRKLLTPDLCIEMLRIGRRSDTAVFVCYLGSLADKSLVREVKKRLNSIDIDGILDSNYIAEYIRDCPSSMLKTTGSTERPDIVAARLLEGRIALVVDGTPVVLTLPYLFSENFQSDEDYYVNFWVAAIGRILRWFCFFGAVSVPGAFVALSTHHAGLLPTHFVLSMQGLRTGVPTATVTECIVLIVVFEILKEAGLRMPQSLGHALSIVGGLVVGQAAVEAKIISAPTLIAVAFSGIAGLMVPRLKGVVSYMRLAFVVFSGVFGLYGFFAVSAYFIIRVFSIKSFGVDYTQSFSYPKASYLKDSLIRAPWPLMRVRPLFNKNLTRSKGARE